jgi:hypothetical protein
MRKSGKPDFRKSDVFDLRLVFMRKSGKPDFRCHPPLPFMPEGKTWMPATSAGMTET